MLVDGQICRFSNRGFESHPVRHVLTINELALFLASEAELVVTNSSNKPFASHDV